MSLAFGSQPAASDDESQQSPQYASDGQRHDRILLEEPVTTTNKMTNSGAVEISTTQRMVSATWGSVLTTLLGKRGD
jgi:hypothetical protein